MGKHEINLMATNQSLHKGVIVIKPNSTSKSDLEVMTAQVAQITTECCKENIVIDSIVITFNGIKDITKRIKTLLDQKQFEYILIYHGKHIADTEKECLNFAHEMRDWYGLNVISYR